MKAIILAGGFATRLWPLTEKKAKPLLLLKNKELVTHIVESIPENIEIIISTNKIFEKDFLNWKEKRFKNRKNIEIFIEDSKNDKGKKGALGALSLIIQEKNIKEDFMVLAGDNYFGFDFKKFIDSYENNPILAVYDVKDLEKAKQFGIVISKNGKTVDEFQEKPENPKSTLASTGAYIFPAKVAKDIIEYAEKKNDDLGGIFEHLKQKNQTINIFSFNEYWFDIGSFQGYLDSHKSIQKESIFYDESCKIKNSELKGAVSISENCEIEDSILENVILFPGIKIKNCEIRNAIIDENCIIENIDISYKIIRANSVLVR